MLHLNKFASPYGSEIAETTLRTSIANKIIELVKTGERNPDLLCERALEDIREDELADWHKWALARAATARPAARGKDRKQQQQEPQTWWMRSRDPGR